MTASSGARTSSSTSPAIRRAGAFVVNRIGDVGMLIGLGILWTQLGTFDFHDINAGLHAPDGSFNQPALSDGGVIYS